MDIYMENIGKPELFVYQTEREGLSSQAREIMENLQAHLEVLDIVEGSNEGN